MATPYATESDVTGDGYLKFNTHDGGVTYVKRSGDSGREIRHEFPGGLTTTQMAQAVERVRFEQNSKRRKT